MNEKKVEKILLEAIKKIKLIVDKSLSGEIQFEIEGIKIDLFLISDSNEKPLEIEVSNILNETAKDLIDLWLDKGQGKNYVCFENVDDQELTIEIHGEILPIHERIGIGLSDEQVLKNMKKAANSEQYEFAGIWRDVLKSRKGKQ